MNFTPGLILSEPRHRPMRWSEAPEEYILPPRGDERDHLLPTSDQGNTSECVSTSVAGAIEYYRWKQRIYEQLDPHRIHLLAKTLDDFPDEPGTTLEAAFQAATQLGYARTENIRSLVNWTEVIQALHAFGVAVLGFTIREGWMHASPDGFIPEGGSILGGHAVLGCAWDLKEGWLGVQGTWGQNQGFRGFNRITRTVFERDFSYGLIWE